MPVVASVRAAERLLGDQGRVLLRPSGTEPLVRVMVEGRDPRQVQEIARGIAEAVRSAAWGESSSGIPVEKCTGKPRLHAREIDLSGPES
jgi:hypothetical protein